jgi:hypothetical protein
LEQAQKKAAADAIAEAWSVADQLDAKKQPVAASYLRGRAYELSDERRQAADAYKSAVNGLAADEAAIRAQVALRMMQTDPRADGSGAAQEPKALAAKCEETLAAVEKRPHLYSNQLRAAARGVCGLAHAAAAADGGPESAAHRRHAAERFEGAVALTAADDYQGWKWRAEAARQLEKLKADPAKALRYGQEALDNAPAAETESLRNLCDRLKGK